MSQTGSGRKTTPFPIDSLAVTPIFRRKHVFLAFFGRFGPSRPHATDHAQRPPVAHTVGVHMSRQVHLSHGVRLGSSGASYVGPYGPLLGCIVEGICDHIRRISRHIATLCRRMIRLPGQVILQKSSEKTITGAPGRSVDPLAGPGGHQQPP